MGRTVVLENRVLRETLLAHGDRLSERFPFLVKVIEMLRKEAEGGCGCGMRSSLASEIEATRYRLATMSQEDKEAFKEIIGANAVIVSYRDGARIRMVRF